MISNLPWLEERHLNYPINDLKLPFGGYIAQCRSLIEQYRLDLHRHAEKIIDANAPFEFSPLRPIPSAHPNKKYKYGALLTHGLFDSPLSVRDIGLHLQANGILARSVLLAGHGIYPGCLSQVSYQEWLQTIRYGIHSLSQEVDHVYLVGFSMGSILSLNQALQNPNIAGMILLSPSFALHSLTQFLLNTYHALSWVKNHSKWLYVDKELDYSRYLSVASNTIEQFHQLCEATQELNSRRHLYCPVLIACSDHDEIVSCRAAIEYFEEQLPESKSRFILYSSRSRHFPDIRISTRTAHYPELNIKNFSHVCIPVAPNNEHYGKDGDYLYASHPHKQEKFGAYNRIQAKFYRQLKRYGLIKKAYSELTYNPDFDFLAQKITQFILSS